MIVLAEKKILYVSGNALEDGTELHIMVEMLSAVNDVVWISPFGAINAALLPSINRVTENLTIYYPGINFLPLQALRSFNEKRRLLQVILYLLGREYEPELILIDDYKSANFASHYSKRGALTVYYRVEQYLDEYSRLERMKFEKIVDLIYRAQELPAEITEEKLDEVINERLQEISALIEAKIS